MSEIKTLIEAVSGFEANSYAILYSPKKCYLAKFDGTKFVDEANAEIKVDEEKVYEARIFNDKDELRWVLGEKPVTLTDEKLKSEEGFAGVIENQQYLLWGELSPSNNANLKDWTELAEARIGKFYVPIKTSSKACFIATEYLKEYDDGNVAVFEERLTGISEVK